MCGIVGCLNKKGKVNTDIIDSMGRMIAHRGPDDYGRKTFSILAGDLNNIENLGIGFVRLSIRDLSVNGHQPMQNADESITIAFNGEIYNADELRPDLQKAGYVFRSSSDTEVLLYAYEYYGIDRMLELLDGMYAICIIDKKSDCFYLVRDRLGEKPLYIYETDSLLLFASEYKAFYCHPEFVAELNDYAVDEYFSFRYVSGNDTMLKGVKNLSPGSYWKISNNVHKEVIYWSLPNVNPNTNSFLENKTQYFDLFKKGLKRRLISDRKIGLQLSGGVDSSVTAAMISSIIDEPIHTFSIIFENKKYSEESYIDIVNEKFGCIPHKYEYSSKMFFDCWRECTWSFEAPMNHEGTLGLMYLNKQSKKLVTVMLCGEGSDETLAGYDRFALTSHRMHHKYNIWETLRFVNHIKRFGEIPHRLTLPDSHISETQYVTDKMFNLLRYGESDGLEKIYEKRRHIMNSFSVEGIHKYLNYEIVGYMQDLLMRADKVSMASSIEVRVPYLMPELVEFACSIPEEHLVLPAQRNYSKVTKRILKSACVDIFGEEFTFRKKSGFSAPLLHLMQDPIVSQYIEDVLLPGIKRRGVVCYDNVCKLWNQRQYPRSNSNGVNWALWTAFSFEMWAQMYLDSNPQNWKHVLL